MGRVYLEFVRLSNKKLLNSAKRLRCEVGPE